MEAERETRALRDGATDSLLASPVRVGRSDSEGLGDTLLDAENVPHADEDTQPVGDRDGNGHTVTDADTHNVALCDTTTLSVGADALAVCDTLEDTVPQNEAVAVTVIVGTSDGGTVTRLEFDTVTLRLNSEMLGRALRVTVVLRDDDALTEPLRDADGLREDVKLLLGERDELEDGAEDALA